MTTIYDEFLRGFRDAAGLGREEAENQWAGFSRALTREGREAEEARGYVGGLEHGREFRRLYPVIEEPTPEGDME